MGQITATAMDKNIRFKSLFSKYLDLNNSDLNNFIMSIPSNFDGVIKTLNEYPNLQVDENIITNRKNLKTAIAEFHQRAGTLTPAVNEQLNMLEEKNLKIIVAIHQPNLFAYGGVYKKIVMMETISNHMTNSKDHYLPLFIVIDHDFMDDSWVHVAKLPSIRNSSGIFDIRYPMNDSKRWKLICKTDPPTPSLIKFWEGQLYRWIKNDKSLNKDQIKKLINNLKNFWEIVEDSLPLSNNYSDFNSIVMSKLINNIWGFKTLFVNLSELYNTFSHGYNFLIANHETYLHSLENSELFFRNHNIFKGISSNSSKYSPLWIHCPCGGKGYSIVNMNRDRDVELSGKCISCKRPLVLNVGKQNRIKIPKHNLSELSPRAIPILLLLSRELKTSGYITGTGGSLGYTIIGKRVFNDLKINMPVLLLWAANDVYSGFAQNEAVQLLHENNVGDISEFLKDAKIKSKEYQDKINPLINKRNQIYSDKNALSDLLNELFYYKNEQRKLKSLVKIVKKSHNALSLKPCLLDYIVNFGMDKISNKWSNTLVKNKDFAFPLKLDSSYSDEKN